MSTLPFYEPVAGDFTAVNQLILDQLHSRVPLVEKIAHYIISAGGKRLRPLVVLLSARACGADSSEQHSLAAIIEFLHTATLLHDDVVDESDLRRGLASANTLWGNKASVLVGDFLFSRSFELMTEDGSLKVLKILSGASAIIAEGEVDQLTAQRKIDTSEQRYLHIIRAKTAALFAAASRIAAVVAECSDEQEQALDEYGRNLGVAFQLVDDALDYDSNAAAMGKDRGDDFREGKMTLPVILAYARGTEEEREFWKAAIGGFRTEDEDLDHAIQLIERHQAVSDTKLRARHFAQRAIDALSIFPDGKARRAMTQAALFAVARGY